MLVVLLAAACGRDTAPPRPLRPAGPGVQHVVKRGENLYRIGKAYDVDFRRLASVNGISDPSQIEVGQKIFVPGATRPLPVELITPSSIDVRPVEVAPVEPGEKPFRWPIANGRLTSRFGPRGESFHDGIDIAAPIGTEVFAARAGRVIYSDELRGYGRLVIVQHDADWITVYAHNSRNEVSSGDSVRAGELVARVGDSGRATGSNLHFEVRRRNSALDPLRFLPPLAAR